MVPILETRDLKRFFGGVAALGGVSLGIGQDEILGLIGPNGSGKSTLVNCLSGVLEPSAGEVLLDGVPVSAWSRSRRARAGILRSYQNLRLFPSLTVSENLAAGFFAGRHRSQHNIAQATDHWVLRLGLGEHREVVVSSLSFGHQRRTEIGRVLMGNPRVLLLDEPAAGLDSYERANLSELLAGFRAERSCSMMVIDHDMSFISQLCDRVIVLRSGSIIFDGTPGDALADPAVVEAYLGEVDGA
jgi:ABC-type branched-subunit amino acid transport system ATPase component